MAPEGASRRRKERRMETFIALGGILMAIAVALGAFGAHALKDKLQPDKLTRWA